MYNSKVFNVFIRLRNDPHNQPGGVSVPPPPRTGAHSPGPPPLHPHGPCTCSRGPPQTLPFSVEPPLKHSVKEESSCTWPFVAGVSHSASCLGGAPLRRWGPTLPVPLRPSNLPSRGHMPGVHGRAPGAFALSSHRGSRCCGRLRAGFPAACASIRLGASFAFKSFFSPQKIRNKKIEATSSDD